MGRWIAQQGGGMENLELIDLSNLKEIYSPAVQEKSETFFFKLMGLR